MDPDTVEKLGALETLLPPFLVAIWRIGVIVILFGAAIRLGQIMERVGRLEAARDYLLKQSEDRDERTRKIEASLSEVQHDVSGMSKALERIEVRLERLSQA
jgi:hypothetical protein